MIVSEGFTHIVVFGLNETPDGHRQPLDLSIKCFLSLGDDLFLPLLTASTD